MSLDPKRLAKAINARHLKKASFARAIGVTPGTLSRYLGGQISPDQPVLLNMARELHVPPEWLTGQIAEDSATYGGVHGTDATRRKAAPLADSPAVSEVDKEYLPDAVALTGLDADERRTMLRMLDALRSGDSEIRRHLIGQLKIIEVALQSRRQQPRAENQDAS